MKPNMIVLFILLVLASVTVPQVRADSDRIAKLRNLGFNDTQITTTMSKSQTRPEAEKILGYAIEMRQVGFSVEQVLRLVEQAHGYMELELRMMMNIERERSIARLKRKWGGAENISPYDAIPRPPRPAKKTGGNSPYITPAQPQSQSAIASGNNQTFRWSNEVIDVPPDIEPNPKGGKR